MGMWSGGTCEVGSVPLRGMNRHLEKGALGQGPGVLTVCEGNVSWSLKRNLL